MEFTKETTQGKADSKKQHAGLLHEFSGGHASIKDNRHATVVQARQKQEAQHSHRTAHQQQMFSSAIGDITRNSDNTAIPDYLNTRRRVKPALQWKNSVPVNDEVSNKTERLHSTQHVSYDLLHGLDAHVLEPNQRSNNAVARSTSPIQRVPIPDAKGGTTKEDTTKMQPDAKLLSELSVIGLIQFWKEVFLAEDQTNAMEWRLAICGVIISKLTPPRPGEQPQYGPYDQKMLGSLSKDEVNEALKKKTTLKQKKSKGNSTKGISVIKVGQQELISARQNTLGMGEPGQTHEDRARKEVTFLQILDLIGIATPKLYGTRDNEQKTLPDLHTDAKRNLLILMDKIATTQPVVLVWDMQPGVLAHRLCSFLKRTPKKNIFDQQKANMLGSLMKIQCLSEALTVCDLQMLIEDETGRLVVIDPGGIVPRGMAGDQDKEMCTYNNLKDACEKIAALEFAAPAKKESAGHQAGAELKDDAVPKEVDAEYKEVDAEYIANFMNTEELLLRLNEAYYGKVTNISAVKIKEGQIRKIIADHRHEADLGEAVEEGQEDGELEKAIALLPPGLRSQTK